MHRSIQDAIKKRTITEEGKQKKENSRNEK
jgi:hypothetical protein